MKKKLEDCLKEKAIGKDGIKYQPDIYGDQNYDVRKLKKEIKKVTDEDKLSLDKIAELKATLNETVKEIPNVTQYLLDFEEINKRIKEIVERPISPADKIVELVNNAMAHKWAEAGCELHKDRKTCLFCGGEITDSRWAALEKHYDKSTADLKEALEKEKNWIKEKEEEVKNLYSISSDSYYVRFKEEVGRINEDMNRQRKECLTALCAIREQIEARRDSIHTKPIYKEHLFDIQKFHGVYSRIQELNKKANEYGNELEKKQKENSESLRRSEVARFKNEIRYLDLKDKIEKKKQKVTDKAALKEDIGNKIKELELEIRNLEHNLQNEKNGAEKVNEILQSHFGHRFIELRAVETGNEEGVYFDVFRQDEKAYNLSEGERNLIAFAYFMAKLEDVETNKEKPIIWIDDPISSLDANHIFFVTSLIKKKIIDNKQKWTQLFISTHNLEFLHYLNNGGYCENGFWLLIERGKDSSKILSMPQYMKKHVTEYVFLFHQIYKIYKCSKIKGLENDIPELFYNFGNNARKFLELYLYYKYPAGKKHENVKRFFDNEVEATCINKICNEFSHNEGRIEQGILVMDYREIVQCARCIVDTIKRKDLEQYNSFLESIGEQEEPNN